MSLLLLLKPHGGTVVEVIVVTGMFDEPTPTSSGYDEPTPTAATFDEPNPTGAMYDEPSPS